MPIPSHSTDLLHDAIICGDELVVAQILAEHPELAGASDYRGWNALHCAAQAGHDNVVAVLLARHPDLTNARVRNNGKTALHLAATEGHDKVVAQLIAANPSLTTVADSLGNWYALHYAASRGHEKIVEMLLAANSESIFAVVNGDYTVLHLASESGSESKQLFARLLELNPAALRAINEDSYTPFVLAVVCENDCAIEAIQWALTIDEIACAFTTCARSYEERFWPIIEHQCEPLVHALTRDVAGIVFGYLGFDSSKQPPTRKKGRTT